MLAPNNNVILRLATLCVTLTSGLAVAQPVYKAINSFNGANGSNPECVLTEVRPGIFIGSTSLSNQNDDGTLFGFSSAGQFLSLVTLDTDTLGALPVGMLFPASDGSFYGTTQAGGPGGNGAVFSASRTAGLQLVTESVIAPSPVIQGYDSNLYFTGYDSSGLLNVYRTSPSSVLVSLYTFPSNAYLQAGPLLQASDGNLYGETAGLAPNYGTIFKLSPSGELSTLYTFQGGTDGAQPLGGLIQANNGTLYGITNAGGAEGQSIGLGNGVIFSITTSGQFTLLRDFDGYDDGANPLASLYQASDGYLYGTNGGPGAVGPGTVYRIGLDGSNFSTQYVFPSSFPQVPGPGAIQGSDGKFYGTLLQGGDNSQGSIFSLDLGLAPPQPVIQKFYPGAGPTGTAVTLAGRDLLGTKTVLFNGIAASFKQAGQFYVVAFVPNGATSGPITLVNINGATQTVGSFIVQ